MENTDWDLTTDRFVAFFDIMGFKDLVLRNRHEVILEKLKNLSNARLLLDSFNSMTADTASEPIGVTKSFTFSDSIFIFTRTDSIADVKKIIVDSNYILSEAFDSEIPIKGALSFGKITVNSKDSIYFGQPIIDSYLLHDDLNLYSVICDHNFQKKIEEIAPIVSKNCLANYKVPLKSGRVNHNLLKPIEEAEKIKSLNNLRKLYLTVSGKPRVYIDNTIEFLESLKY